MPFDRKVFFDEVRKSLFGGSLQQNQVDGMNFILTVWENSYAAWDLRWLSYSFATTHHETAMTMLPIEEYGKGKGKLYGKQDPETKQTYYGRGFVQLTWRDNYLKATTILNLTGSNDLVWHAERALDPTIAATIMFIGMEQGWFRGDPQGRQKFSRYFNSTTNDPYGAREIINGDKKKIPTWSGGVSIGNVIKGYHNAYLDAVTKSWQQPEPVPEPVKVHVSLVVEPADAAITVEVNGIRFQNSQ